MSNDQLRQALRDVDFPAGKDDHSGQHLSQYPREVPKPAVEDDLDEN
jgi:hypothetical protein